MALKTGDLVYDKDHNQYKVVRVSNGYIEASFDKSYDEVFKGLIDKYSKGSFTGNAPKVEPSYVEKQFGNSYRNPNPNTVNKTADWITNNIFNKGDKNDK